MVHFNWPSVRSSHVGHLYICYRFPRLETLYNRVKVRFKSAKHAQRFLSADRAPSLDISIHEDIVCVPGSIVPFCRADSSNGMR